MEQEPEKHYCKTVEGKVICIEDYNKGLREFPSNMRQVIGIDGRAAITNVTYVTHACGCTIEGCGTLQFPLTIKFCDKHSKEPETPKTSFTLADANELLKKEGYFIHHPEQEPPVTSILDVDGREWGHLAKQLEEAEVYSYKDTHEPMAEHLYSIQSIKDAWEEGDIELGLRERTFLDETEAEMAKYDCAYFRMVRV